MQSAAGVLGAKMYQNNIIHTKNSVIITTKGYLMDLEAGTEFWQRLGN